MYQHILIPLDGSEVAELALPHVEALAAKFDSKLTLFRATTPPEALVATTAVDGAMGVIDPTPMIEEERAAADQYIRGLSDRLRAAGLTIDVDIQEGDADHLIVERAAALGIDLIAMTTHGRGGLERIVLGSVADHVVRHAPCPVLLIRVTDQGQEATDTE